METALVTGGAGFIGAHLVKRLAREASRVVVIDDLSWGHPQKLQGLDNVELIRADVANLSQHREALRSVSHVFHLAALISAYDSIASPDAYIRTNVNGLLRVIELCAELPHPKLIFASTSGVYGNSPAAVKREVDRPQPATVYAVTKLMGEHLLDIYRERGGYDDVSLRLFNVYGPGQNPKHPYANVTCKFARAAALSEAVTLFGDGEQTRDFVFVDDVVDALMLVASNPCQSRVYNVGTGKQASIGSLLELVQQISGARLDVERAAAWPNDIRAVVADTERLQKELGFRARVELAEGLRETIQYFKAEGESA